MMRIKNSIPGFAIMLFVIALTGSGCKKILDIEASNLINEKNAWASINDGRAALLGTYGLLRTALAENEANWLYGELRGSVFQAISRPDLQAVIDGRLDQSYDLLSETSNWRKFYAVINSANLFIERSPEILAKDPQYTRLNNSVDIAQMKAIIGMSYFYMVRIWGDVPLLTQSYDGSFPQLPRSEAKAVLKYAEDQLKEAAAVLPFIYGDINADYFPGLYYGSTNSTWSSALLNRNAAYAILAHIAAWDHRYLDASIYADFVINNAGKSGIVGSTIYDLTRADGFFQNVNNNQLFALGMASSWGESTPRGHIENLALASPLIPRTKPLIYVPASKVIEVFNEPKDERFHITAEGVAVSAYFTNPTSDLPIFSKIKVVGSGIPQNNTAGQPTNVVTTYSSPVLFTRLEEIKLLKAEALAVLGQDNEAWDMLNGQRQGRGLSELDGTTDLVDEIFHERHRELLGEAWRWYDIVRYKKIKNNDPAFNTLIQKGGIYWPVAQLVMDNNNLVRQTEYWKK